MATLSSSVVIEFQCCVLMRPVMCFFFNDTATTEIYTLSLHDALPISCRFGAADRHRQHGSRPVQAGSRSEEHTSELQSPCNLVCRLLLEKKATLPWCARRHRCAARCLVAGISRQDRTRSRSWRRPCPDRGSALFFYSRRGPPRAPPAPQPPLSPP